VQWLLTPAAMSMAAALLLALPLKIYGLQLPEPVFAMAPAFAWALIRPSMLPPFVLTGLGLFQDILWGGPLGFWPICLLALYGLAFSARRVLSSEGFWVLGAGYATFSLAAFAVALGLALLASGEVASLIGVGLQFLVTLALFPLAWLLIERFEDADVRFR